MGLYNNVLNKAIIYDCFFFKINSVLEYKNLTVLKDKRNDLFETWISLSKDTAEKQGLTDEEYYKKYAPLYPEYTKIVGATYAILLYENQKLKKQLDRVINNNEIIVLERFFDILYTFSTNGSNSTPKDFKTLTGFNITYSDIPLLIKRYFINREYFKEKNKELPFILKNTLDLRPWDNTSVIDLAHIWNFKGRNIYSLDLISNFLSLKKPHNILSAEKISSEYWKILDEDDSEEGQKKALKMIALQGTLDVNLVIQAVNYLRSF